MARIDVVIPTIGRPSLSTLLDSLAASIRGADAGGRPTVFVVDDRSAGAAALPLPRRWADTLELVVLASSGRGPAAARNVGWRASQADWVAFVDDDVVVTADWWADLHRDVADAAGSDAEVAGIQGRIEVPLPSDRRPTDFERGTAGLQTARWITADLVYRRAALVAVGGFDERFRRAFREDSDLALRLLYAGYRIVTGRRRTLHPVRPADRWVSVRQQAGNADDVLMQRLHGPGWRDRAAAPVGRIGWHALTGAAALVAACPLPVRGRLRWAALGLWLAGWTEFSWRRIAPGPRTRSEILTMLATSAAIPPAACWHRAVGMVRHRSVRRCNRPAAVLFDRDGTLVQDVPYNGDPAAVRPVAGARRAVRRLRRAGIPVAVVSNQSGIGRGLLTESQVEAVNGRVEELLGRFDGWFVCPHTAQDGCSCRKPAPGLVIAAAAALGVQPADCLVIGDIGSDVRAASEAGARSILVPTVETRPDEVAQAPCTAPDLASAVRLALSGRAGMGSGALR